jgi:hypothetical protein
VALAVSSESAKPSGEEFSSMAWRILACRLKDVDGRRAIRRKRGMSHSGFEKHVGGQLGQACELQTGWRWAFVEQEVGEAGLVTLVKAGWWKVVVQVA